MNDKCSLNISSNCSCVSSIFCCSLCTVNIVILLVTLNRGLSLEGARQLREQVNLRSGSYHSKFHRNKNGILQERKWKTASSR